MLFKGPAIPSAILSDFNFLVFEDYDIPGYDIIDSDEANGLRFHPESLRLSTLSKSGTAFNSDGFIKQVDVHNQNKWENVKGKILSVRISFPEWIPFLGALPPFCKHRFTDDCTGIHWNGAYMSSSTAIMSPEIVETYEHQSSISSFARQTFAYLDRRPRPVSEWSPSPREYWPTETLQIRCPALDSRSIGSFVSTTDRSLVLTIENGEAVVQKASDIDAATQWNVIGPSNDLTYLIISEKTQQLLTEVSEPYDGGPSVKHLTPYTDEPHTTSKWYIWSRNGSLRIVSAASESHLTHSTTDDSSKHDWLLIGDQSRLSSMKTVNRLLHEAPSTITGLAVYSSKCQTLQAVKSALVEVDSAGYYLLRYDTLLQGHASVSDAFSTRISRQFWRGMYQIGRY